MPSNGEKELGEFFKDKFRSIFSPKDPQKKKDASFPKAHFSVWYFLSEMKVTFADVAGIGEAKS